MFCLLPENMFPVSRLSWTYDGRNIWETNPFSFKKRELEILKVTLFWISHPEINALMKGLKNMLLRDITSPVIRLTWLLVSQTSIIIKSLGWEGTISYSSGEIGRSTFLKKLGNISEKRYETIDLTLRDAFQLSLNHCRSATANSTSPWYYNFQDTLILMPFSYSFTSCNCFLTKLSVYSLDRPCLILVWDRILTTMSSLSKPAVLQEDLFRCNLCWRHWKKSIPCFTISLPIGVRPTVPLYAENAFIAIKCIEQRYFSITIFPKRFKTHHRG